MHKGCPQTATQLPWSRFGNHLNTWKQKLLYRLVNLSATPPHFIPRKARKPTRRDTEVGHNDCLLTNVPSSIQIPCVPGIQILLQADIGTKLLLPYSTIAVPFLVALLSFDHSFTHQYMSSVPFSIYAKLNQVLTLYCCPYLIMTSWYCWWHKSRSFFFEISGPWLPRGSVPCSASRSPPRTPTI